MPKKTASQVLDDLAKLYELVHPSGEINYTAFGKRTGIPIPTVSRIHRGGKEWVLQGDTLQKLVESFGISYEQAMGFEPITRNKRKRSFVLSASEKDLIRRLRTLDKQERQEINELVEFKAQKKVKGVLS